MDTGSRQNPSRPVTFRHSAAVQAVLVLSMVAMLAFPIFMLSQGQQYIWLLIPLPLMGFLAWEFIRRMGSVTIDAEGVRRTGFLGSEKFIRWADLTVQSDWSRRHLLLRDSLGENKITLDNDLDGFGQAVELVRRRRLDLFQAEIRSAAGPSGVASFRLFSVVLLVVPSLVVAFVGTIILVNFVTEMSSPGDSGGGQLAWVLFLVVATITATPLFFMLLQPLSMRLDRQELEVRYLTGKQRFLAGDIQDIRLDVVSTGRGERQTQISIVSRQGKTLRLRGPSSGGPWLYCLLKTWWEGQR